MASIVPSILAGDFARLGESLDAVQALGVPAIHIDIMDGHFRPQISVGQPVVRSIRKATDLKLGVHLMVERPERYIEDFVDAGADSLAFHPEATEDIDIGIGLARNLGVKLGLALSLGTPVDACCEVLEDLDFVLIQTGAVGSAVETFVPRAVNKVAAISKERETRGLNFAIEAEGGIGPREAGELLQAGADILVVGSAIFDKEDRGEAMRAMVRKLGRGASVFNSGPESRVN
ncbi:MAG: ribulose-phosphate 3-epimerase [Acidobacteriota bacterium]